MRRISVSVLVAGTLALSACTPDAPPAPPAPAAPAPPAAPALPPAPETVTARYDCPGAAVVEIIRDGRFARLRMTDGRIVNLGVIRGSKPPVWSEVGLRFVTSDDGAELSQDNGRTVRCSVAGLETDTPETVD
ncbi:hypothetical protein [Luteimonas terrae]|uniref:C-type lysozyme inhibitor domain-containing protein n=1 Tax=Luteimonas terrae TaxID=1530191 RepID=A0A4R5UEN7_9GAMM|nr:hypothetical protein [Luteimonas terrae]TDK33789.1 hypothetical protein E2F49_07330 [Luteimonas terrae]